MRTAVVGLAASAAVAVGAATAVAATLPTPSGPVNLAAKGVKFTGTYKFHGVGDNHGGFGYPGTVYDTGADGNNVFVHAKVEGYDYGSRTYTSGGNGHSAYENLISYDPAETYVSAGEVQACVDRGTLFPDVCNATGTLKRG